MILSVKILLSIAALDRSDMHLKCTIYHAICTIYHAISIKISEFLFRNTCTKTSLCAQIELLLCTIYVFCKTIHISELQI